MKHCAIGYTDSKHIFTIIPTQHVIIVKLKLSHDTWHFIWMWLKNYWAAYLDSILYVSKPVEQTPWAFNCNFCSLLYCLAMKGHSNITDKTLTKFPSITFKHVNVGYICCLHKLDVCNYHFYASSQLYSLRA